MLNESAKKFLEDQNLRFYGMKNPQKIVSAIVNLLAEENITIADAKKILELTQKEVEDQPLVRSSKLE